MVVVGGGGGGRGEIPCSPQSTREQEQVGGVGWEAGGAEAREKEITDAPTQKGT